MTIHPNAPQHRLCLAADVEQYGRLDTRAQSAVQADLVRVLDEAARLSGLHRTAWARQPQGDQEFAVLPAGTRESVVLDPFVRHLTAALAAVNAHRTTRVRLRLAVDAGVVSDAALGHAGPAPVAVARYLDAPQLKAVLAALTTTDLAVIVSDRLYQDVVRLGQNGLDPGRYVKVHVQAKEFAGYGWIHVPGHAPDELRPLIEQGRGPDLPAAGRTGRAALTQYVHHGAAVGGDVSGGITVGLPAPVPPADPRRAR
ncbi:hypothetical protein ACH47Z_22670 [Streptomyces sp. NPDC020192]|uniref:hypothetical protein n=1 Tax=Streptomyces sp. NPDC020192 TaxID=3365066 RepID=UPI0037A9FB06